MRLRVSVSIIRLMTDREKQLVVLLIDGDAQREAAHKLGISKNTARNHLANARAKTGCKSTLELAIKFYRESSQTT